MAQSSFPLYVDYRVGSVELAKNIRLPVEVTTLPFGDFAFLGYGPEERIWNFGIERKTFPDLLSCIESGRFSGHQLNGLLNHYHVVYLLIEGEYKLVDGDIFIPSGSGRTRWIPVGGAKRQHRFSYSQYSGFINTLQVIPNLKFWFTKTKNETGAFVRDTYFHWQKKWSEHRGHLQFHEVERHSADFHIVPPGLVQRFAKELKGVGWERAGWIEDKFRNMDTLMKATVKDFLDMPGIGKTLAESIHKQIHAN